MKPGKPAEQSPEFQQQVADLRARVSAELDFLRRVRMLIAAGRDAEAEAEIRAYYRDESIDGKP